MSRPVTWAAVNAHRLRAHGLLEPLPSLAAAAAAMAGVHAQVMSAAEVSLGLRVAGTTRRDVAAALWEERTLVKTFGPRGTVHLLPTADLPWWLAALGSLPGRGGHASWVRLDAAETDAVVAALDDALSGQECTTEELDRAVGEACGPWAVEETMPAFGGFWPRWRQAIGTAAVRGVLCFGRPRGRRVTYASLSSWVPGLTLPTPEEGQALLLAAYLTAYGPATPAHLAQWLATTPAWTADLFARADLAEVTLEGEAAWMLPDHLVAADESEVPAVLLLPYFDAFAVGSQPRRLLFPSRAAERALAGSQAGNFPVLLLDGVVGGVWHQRRSGGTVAVTVEPLAPLSARQRSALEQQVERVGVIVEARPELTVGPVSVGPHA